MTEINENIHVLADETLGGIKREYVEVDRKAEVGEKIVIVNADVQCEEPYNNGDIIEVESLRIRGIQTPCHRDIFDFEYHVLEPTDIVHIDGRRYEMIDREAEVGEKIIHLYEGESNGVAREVRKTDDEGVEVDPYEDEEGVWIGLDHGYYRVLVPVEATEDEPKPADPIDVIASLAQEVASLKRTVDRHRDEIDTLHKDNRTLGEELARLKYPAKNESIIESAPFVLVIHGGRGDFDVYQRGKKIENISRLEIEADSRIGSSIDLEFNNVGERP
ncbi:hypothetical protein P9738_12970 [Bacillus siamensis]|uniref:hypothetical protein n=1 Tax=Bacillus siamensis TaxID=659243 RepID=UPI002E1DC6DE|nr:hypothetical protein [Bacillus siamensis]MED5097113.1 hypothetical protein [Bacillus siamensis]